MKRKFSACVLAFMAVNIACLAVAEDAYVESSGVAGISTGYHLKPSTRIEVDFALTTLEQAQGARLFGADYNNAKLKMALGFYIGVNDNTRYWVFGFGNESGWDACWPKDSSGNYVFADTSRHVITYDFPAGCHTYYTDGKKIAWQTDGRSYTSEATAPITLFSTTDNSGKERPSKARIYGVKIYEKVDDEYVLVRDFKPCVATGRMGMPAGVSVAGFKCAVTGGFIGNAENHSSFTAGEKTPAEKVSLAYVDTGAVDNKGYIDTRYIPTVNTRCEIDYSLNSAPSASGWLFSASGDGAYYGVYLRGGYENSYYGHNGTGWHKPLAANGALTLDTPRTVVLDYPANKFLVCSGIVTNAYPVTAYAATGKTYTGSIRLGTKYNASDEFASIKIYGFRIFEDGKLVRNFVPCKMDGVAGLHDLETGLFVACAKPLGALDAGGDINVKMSPYIETALGQKQYLNTGHIPTINTRIEVDYALASAYTSGTWNIFRGKLDSDDYFTCYHNANGFGAKNAGGWPGVHKDFANVPKVRRTAILDNYHDKGALVTANVTNYSVTTANTTSLSGVGAAIWLSSTQAGDEYGSLRIFACRIFEADKIVYEYLPSVKADGSVGLQDTRSTKFIPVLSKSDSNPQVYGGAFPCTVTPATKKLPFGSTVTLAAAAPGAKSYRWLKNGVPVEGGMDGKLVVDWSKGEEMDVYQAMAVFEVDGVRVEGEASAGATVTNLPASFYFTIH